jgi:hypothetical protein
VHTEEGPEEGGPMTKTHQYGLEIKKGLPLNYSKTRFPNKAFEGELIQVAKTITHGHYVKISAGSQGKFREIVESRDLKTVVRRGQGESRGTVFVVTAQWLSEHPECLGPRAKAKLSR